MDARSLAFEVAGPLVGRMLPVSYPLAELAGGLAWRFRPALRRHVMRNLYFTGVERERLRAASRRTIVRAASYWVDAMSMPYRDMQRFETDHLVMEDGHYLEVFEQPGPVIIASAHTGNAELAIQALLARQRPFVAMVEPLQPPEFMERMLRARQASGATFVPANRDGIRACIKALRSGGVVGLMADRDFAGNGICVELFGRRVRLPRGPWELARRYGAKVIPMFSLRRRRDQFTVRSFEPFTVARTGDEQADLREGASRWARAFEATLAPDPAQWVLLGDYLREHACAKG